jgi:hypothetical protein
MFTREFICKSTQADLRDEVRFSDEESRSNLLLRDTDGAFERGATYKVTITKVQGADAQPMVVAEVPAEDAALIPASATVKKKTK